MEDNENETDQQTRSFLATVQPRLGESRVKLRSSLFSVYCEVCADDNKHLEAEGFCVQCRDYLCDDCVKAHAKNRASKTHVVQTKSQMPPHKPSPPLPKATTDSSTEKCDKHPDRPLEFYCKDDGGLGCTVCLVKHRQCQAVDHLSDLSEYLLDSQEYGQFTDTLTTLKTQSKDVIKDIKESASFVDEQCNDVTTVLQDLRRKSIAAFETLEEEVGAEVEQLKSSDMKKLKGLGDKGNDVLDEVEAISADIETMQSKNQLCQLFVKMIKLKDRVQELQTLLDETKSNNTITTCTFEPGVQVQNIIAEPVNIGKLCVTCNTSLPPPIPPRQNKPTDNTATRDDAPASLPAMKPGHEQDLAPTEPEPETPTQEEDPLIAIYFEDIKAEHVGDIEVRTQNDKEECRITGSVLLPDNKMVLADFQNEKVKLLNLETEQVTSELKTSASEPWGVTRITGDQVAVTLRDAGNILFVTAAVSGLMVDREMAVDGKCTAIIYNSGKLIVAFMKPLKIEFMSLSGTVERKIQHPNLFDWPSHMTLSPALDAIYVSDFSEDDLVKKLSLGGAVETEYEFNKLCLPRGLLVDDRGRVLVCGEYSKAIHLLEADPTKEELLLIEGLDRPQSLSLCHNTNRLYVGSWNNKMAVYQLPCVCTNIEEV